MTAPANDLPDLAHLIQLSMTRRVFVRGGIGALMGALSLREDAFAGCAPRSEFPLTFSPVASSVRDEVVVPDGYEATVLLPWGQPLRTDGPDWSPDCTADDQQQQVGMHNDGMHFFPIDGSSTHGYLVTNHEYTDEGLLHRDGTANWSAEKVRKSQAAQGVSIVEIRWKDNQWHIVDGRRVTGRSEIDIAGPVRGHPLMRTAGSDGEKAGTMTLGTFANCANGVTPWGTYLTCEENFHDYFKRTPAPASQLAEMPEAERRGEERMSRYGIGSPYLLEKTWRSTYGWDAFDEHYDSDREEYRNHSHRYGWVVEIDPHDRARRPAKRTALGRCRHENAAVVVAPSGQVVVYMGDDARFEYIYKFVSDARISDDREKNWGLLDHGTLYAAKFEDGDTGRWLELSLDTKDAEARAKLQNEFSSDEEILVFARRAADLVGATRMDRPEWIAVDQDPHTKRLRDVYVTLTNNDKRGTETNHGPDAANPRPDNVYGHVLRWRETRGDPTATTFRWSPFLICGKRDHPEPHQRGNVRDAAQESQDFGSPDGLHVDDRGAATILWIQTDVSTSTINRGPYDGLGNNQMLAADPATGLVRRFLTGPRGCEVTGFSMTPDRRNLFVNIQHPGEQHGAFNDPNKPLAVSNWPNGANDERPRSATIVVRRKDGRPVGT